MKKNNRTEVNYSLFGQEGSLPTLHSHYSKLNNLLYVSYVPKVINAAIEIKLFEALSKNDFSLTYLPSDFTLDAIASNLGAERKVTEALLNVLEKIGLISITNNTYSLTVLAEEYLVQSSETCQINAIQQFNGSSGPFDYIVQALKGEMPEFDGKMWNTKEASINMEQGMKAGGLQGVLKFVKSLHEFASCTKMCDLAGNVGYFSYAFLNENKNLKAHVYDLPEVCENAKELKQNEPDFNRVTYHGFDMKKGDDFGEGYDLFFISHYLYEYGAKGELVDFLKRVNKAMKPGGIFVSNHICDNAIDKESELTLALVELHTRILGYPTHQLPESVLKEALTEAGFSEFKVQQPDGSYGFPTMMVAARKK